MTKLKKLLPLWILLAVVVGTLAVVFALEHLETRLGTERVLPVAVALDDGLWELHPGQEPKRLHSWSGGPRFAVYHRWTAFQSWAVPSSWHTEKQVSYVFEGEQVHRYEAETGVYQLVAEHIPVDHELGPAGTSVSYYGDCNDFTALCWVHSDSGRMETVNWCNQPVEVWTVTVMKNFEECTTYEVPFTPREGWYYEEEDGRALLYTFVRREDGKCATIRTDLEVVSSSTQGGWWDEERFGDGIEKLERNQWNALQKEPKNRRYPYLPVEPYGFLIRKPWGSLYFVEWSMERGCVDAFSGVSEAEFLAAELHDTIAIVRTETDTRVYAYFFESQTGSLGKWIGFTLEG